MQIAGNVKKHAVLVVGDGVLNPALMKRTRRQRHAETVFHQRGQRSPPAQAEELALNPVIFQNAVVPAGGVQNPVSDVHKVQKLAEFSGTHFNRHPHFTFPSMA